MFKAKAVFPIDGRAATIIRSDGCKPEVIWLSSVKPVSMPVSLPFLLSIASIWARVVLRVS
jgi:hypothetical protein